MRGDYLVHFLRSVQKHYTHFETCFPSQRSDKTEEAKQGNKDDEIWTSRPRRFDFEWAEHSSCRLIQEQQKGPGVGRIPISSYVEADRLDFGLFCFRPREGS